YYSLKSPATSEVRLEVLDSQGKLVRAYSSADKPSSPQTPPAFLAYWFQPPDQLSTAPGMHRFIWDLRYALPAGPGRGYSMSTVFGRNVPSEPEGPQALPGSYQVRLTVDGKNYMQPFALTMDPRVKTTPDDLQRQFTLQTRLVQAMQEANQAAREIHEARAAGRIGEDIERKLAGGRGGAEGTDLGGRPAP